MEDDKLNVYFRVLGNSDISKIFENLKSFIINRKWGEIEFSSTDIKKADLIVAFTRMVDLHENETYEIFLDEKNELRRIAALEKDKRKEILEKKDYSPIPMIVIGIEDITGVKTHLLQREIIADNVGKGRNKENLENIKRNYETLINALNLDKRALFFDSSIWQRYVALNEDFEERFENTLKEICSYHELGLYKTTVAMEYLEFRTRMMLNSFLAPLQYGHALNISPFHFHSETLMRERAKEEFEKFKDSSINWKFLLVDDFADAWLTKRKSEDSSDKKYKCTKAEILSKILCSFDNNLNSIIDIEPVIKNEKIKKDAPHKNVIKGFNKKIEKNQFDIIMLDYLLGKGQNSEREKCTQILEDIESDAVKIRKSGESSKYKNNGPLDKFWFFPISAFSYAMLDDIRERGMGHHTDLWELSSGADPINTPNLFLFKLFRFMNQQIKETAQFKIESSSNVANDEGKIQDLYDFLKFYFEKDDDEDIRAKAKRCYPDFVEMHGKFEKLSKQRKTKQEGFIASILKTYYKGHTESFFEHLQHLIYLLAYGSPVQAPEMWEEFQFIKNNIEKEVINNKLKSVFDNISKYIVNLNH